MWQLPQLDPENWLKSNPDATSATIAICDINGVFRGKRVPVEQIVKIFKDGVRMPTSSCTVDIWGCDLEDSELVFDSGDADAICTVTDRGLVERHIAGQISAFVPVTMFNEDGTPEPTDPRQALAAIVDRFKSHGYRPVVATELEFYLTSGPAEEVEPATLPGEAGPLEHHNVLSVAELDQLQPFLDDIYAEATRQGIVPDAIISESGTAQFELNLMHSDDALRAADDAVLFKNLVRSVARAHGFRATFMAKPFGDKAGNGLHVHFSVLDAAGQNIFDNGTDDGSDLMLHAVAGLAAMMTDSALIFAPHQNSYRRIRPNAHAPTAVAWGYENRTCAIRIPGGANAARRIEHRVAGGDANPYLVLTAILGAAIYGIENKLTPPAPTEGNAYETDAPLLPLHWHGAIDAFEKSTLLPHIIDPQLIRLFAQIKTQELDKLLSIVPASEYSAYLETV
ncbi:glutamine synthetase family protein [Pacificibacter marinus]|uniref:glutamine synthetase family protein n=1 Tax=Pacificibacter marinus TaxID=658057 RepID=UPI001C07FE56|nr:glutamine synthetase family protein [Pacificibacter marinus]